MCFIYTIESPPPRPGPDPAAGWQGRHADVRDVSGGDRPHQEEGS